LDSQSFLQILGIFFGFSSSLVRRIAKCSHALLSILRSDFPSLSPNLLLSRTFFSVYQDDRAVLSFGRFFFPRAPPSRQFFSSSSLFIVPESDPVLMPANELSFLSSL